MQNLVLNLGYGVRLFARAPGFTLLAVLTLALAFSRALATLLFGVSPTDPLSYASVSAVLLAVAALACYIPARRATLIDPLEALRAER